MLGWSAKGMLLPLLGCLLLCDFARGDRFETVNGRRVIPGRLLLRLAADGREPATGNLRNLGFRHRRSFRLARAQLWQIPAGLSVARAVRMARSMPGVVVVEPDYVRTLSLLPNDSSFYKQYAPGKMSLPQAWDITTGDSGIVVAVIDTGVQYDHPDLRENIYENPTEVLDKLDNDGNGYIDDIHGWDFVGARMESPKPDNDPTDFHGHGTKVAGIIGAAGNNQEGVAGVAWAIRIMPLKAGEDSTSSTLSASACIEAVEYAVSQGAHVINASYGGDVYSHFELEAAQAAQEAGLLLVAASGNDGKNIDGQPEFPMYPGTYNLANILCVAATVSTDALASYSNYGIKSVDLAAPGSGIYTTQRVSTYGNGYGTSFAAPQVSGIAALMRGQFPTMNVRKLRLMLMEEADTIASHSGKTVTSGRANAFASLCTQMPWTKRYAVTLPVPRSIPDNDPKGITETIDMTDDVTIRGVMVFVEVDHPWMDDIGVTIESPSGTVNVLETPAPYDDNRGFFYEYDTQLDFQGEGAAGTWTLTVTDCRRKGKGVLIRWGLEIYADGPNEDINGDGCVNILDLIIARNALRSSAGRADINSDGQINVLDLISVRNSLGLCEDD